MLHNSILLPKQILTSSQEVHSHLSPKRALSFLLSSNRKGLLKWKGFHLFLICRIGWKEIRMQDIHIWILILKTCLAHNSLLSSELSQAPKNCIIYSWATPPQGTDTGISPQDTLSRWNSDLILSSIILHFSVCIFLRKYSSEPC